MEAVILDIQRMSTEDGPGLRTTVFFKGCNLRCAWCHNPESLSFKPDVNWYKNKCIACGLCEGVCPQKGIRHKMIESGENFDVAFTRELCIACRNCETECPAAAIELKGKAYSLEALFFELVKDRSYFGADGGVTLSGGEVMCQSEAACDLARRLKEDGVNVALDTAGCYQFSTLEKILPYISLVLYDIKIFNATVHKQYTESDNALILENYKKLIERGARVWVRTPIIEGATDSVENIESIGRFIQAAGLPEKWELCAFNNLCRDKYIRLDIDWKYKNVGRTKKSLIERLTEIARQCVPCAEWSGAVVE
jgi:pyruvate formate lyase activating enzyme